MIGSLVGLLVGYSLTGLLSGVYRFPALDVVDPRTRSYLVWERDHWVSMLISDDNKTIYLAPDIDRGIRIQPGIWTREVVRTWGGKGSDTVITPWNLFDVYLIRCARDGLTVTDQMPAAP